MKFIFCFWFSLLCMALQAQESPNILLIIADDLGIDAIEGFGIEGDLPVTPTLDSLRASGISFTNCWATPQCTPTRAAIMSGKYGIKTGIFRPPGPLTLDHTSIFNKIKETSDVEYSTAAFGKWHISGNNNPNHPLELGADHFEGFENNINRYYNWEKTTNGEQEQVREYLTSHITNSAIDWVENQTDPWMLWLAHAAPHVPLEAPPAGLFTTQPGSNRSTYQSMIEAMDFEIGRLINSLDESVRENTVIIFIGDNGTPNATNNFFPRGHVKGSIYEGGLRVPLIMSGNRISRNGEVEAGLVQAADLYATILELVGVELPGGIYNSLSLRPHLAEPNLKLREFIYSDYDDDGLLVWAIRTDRYKMIFDINGNQEFFDIVADIKEENNLINNLTPEQSEIKELLEQEVEAIRTDWSCNDNIQNGSESDIDACEMSTSTSDLISQGFQIIPNPNHGVFRLSMPGNGAYEVFLFDSKGSLLRTVRGTHELSFEGLRPSTYTIMVNQHNIRVGSSTIVVH